jgi:hypothetical protein
LPFAKLIGGRFSSFRFFLKNFFGLKGRGRRADELGKGDLEGVPERIRKEGEKPAPWIRILTV